MDKDVPSAASVLYFEVDDLEEVYSGLKDQSVKFITKPEGRSWGGKTALMLDLDSNIVILSQASA